MAEWMPVARVHGPGDMRIDQVPVPEVGPHDVLVRVRATGICGSDLGYVAAGGLGGGVPLPEPLALGHEFAGVVARVGDAVEGIAPGLRCAVNPDDGFLGAGGGGAMAPWILIRNAAIGAPLFPIPDDLPFAEAALAEPLSVALHGINIAGVTAESRVVVLGAGPIGLGAVVGLRHRGVRNIVVVDLSEARLARARKLGASATVNPAGEDLFAAISRAQGQGTRFGVPCVETDAFIDAAGAAKALTDVVAIAKYQARIVVIALYHKPVPLDMWRLMANEITVTGSIADARAAEFGECVGILANREFPVDALISHEIPAADILDGFRLAADREHAAKVVLSY